MQYFYLKKLLMKCMCVVDGDIFIQNILKSYLISQKRWKLMQFQLYYIISVLHGR